MNHKYLFELILQLITSYEEPSGLNSYDYKIRGELLTQIKKYLKSDMAKRRYHE